MTVPARASLAPSKPRIAPAALMRLSSAHAWGLGREIPAAIRLSFQARRTVKIAPPQERCRDDESTSPPNELLGCRARPLKRWREGHTLAKGNRELAALLDRTSQS